MNAARRSLPALALGLLLAGLAGCDNMQHQDYVRPYEASVHFADGASARLPPAHTVARRAPAPDDPVATGKMADLLVTEIPVPLTHDLLERGRERFGIFCAACHGEDGYGQGLVVRRGFPAPPSLHEARLREAPAGQLFDVITHGTGRMYPQADQIEPRDRWAIVAYLRALQRSQHATLADLPVGELQQLSAR
jgi:mono/diheme cytochrome c family protein